MQDKFAMLLYGFFVLVFSFGLGVRTQMLPAPEAQASEAREHVDWRHVVASLDIVREEYPDALAADQKDRMAVLASLLDKRLAEVHDSKQPQLVAKLKALSASMHSGTEPKRIGRNAGALADEITNATALPKGPPAKPNLGHGLEVYALACASCHGADGSGNSSAAETMDPKPADLVHPFDNDSPYQAYNRISYGGHETAMPEFREALSEQDRWDVVFYLFAARWPPCSRQLSPVSTDKLAQSGDFDLWREYGYGAAGCLRRQF